MALTTSPRFIAGHRDAQRSAESLFESQSVAQIREVETKARNDIEDKKHHLRQLVGGSYRDLIDSADTILSMTTCCQAAVSQVHGIQNDFNQLSESIRKVSKATGHRVQSGSQREQLFAVGSRVKYVVDTSELLWGCLDTQAYLEAAHRYLRASEVHRILMGTAASSMGRFPLLRHQWPSIAAFKSHILDGVQHRLKTHTSLDAHAAASALAASCFLDHLSSAQALALFLDCCRHRAIQPLAAATKSGLSQSALQELLTNLAATVQEVVVQVGQLFLAPVAAVGVPLLLKQASDDSSSSELLFSPLPGQERSQEADAWQAVRRSTLEGLQPLSQLDASSACTSWLGRLAKDIQKHCCPGPMAACAAPPDFASLEAHLQSTMTHWQPPRQPPAQESGPLVPTPRPAPLTPSLSPLTPLGQSPFEAVEAAQSGSPDSWEGVCDWVLGKRLDLWQELFEAPFLKRAQALIKASFQGISRDFTAPLQACLKAAQQAPPAPPGGYYAPRWPEQGSLGTSTQLGSISRHAGATSRSYQMRKRARLGRADVEGSKEGLGWRGLLEGVGQQVNSQLMQALEGSQRLLGQPPQNSNNDTMDEYSGSSSTQNERGSSPLHRAGELQPFIQEQCFEAVQAMAEQLQAALQQLGQPAMDLQGAHLVEQALLLGRLSRIVGSNNPALGLILGPPEGWGRPEGVTLAAQRALRPSALEHKSSVKSHGAALHQDLQQKLRDVTMSAYEVWAGWVGRGLCMQLQAALQSDAALTSSTPLQAWEETIIAQEDGMEEGGGEMRFRLPAAPSPGPLMFLLAACREVARAGGHTTGAVAVQLLEWELGNAVLEAFSEVLQSSGSLSGKVSEKGLLQLLFDVRFLSDALAGGRPLNDTPPPPPPPSRLQRGQGKAQSPAVQGRHRAFQSLEASLSSQLDPIDWATYEPYLWGNEATYYQRAATLFGALLQTQRLHAQIPPKPATALDANILSLAPTAPRFSYLPISTPSLHLQTMRHMPARSALPASSIAGTGLLHPAPAVGLPTGPARPSDMLEQTGDYSFANISVGRTVSAVTAEQQRAVESASGTTLESLQSKFSAGTTASSQRLGAFGSLLGDKAAEVTAMAQQSLGDYVPSAFPSGLASTSLSGFTSQASGLFAGFKGLRGSSG
ncbi:hypothetical protein ABBQ38_004612 [Trebouxia sp. C0009 RCD-2024]